MDQDVARARLTAERAEVERLLKGAESAAVQDRLADDEPGDSADAAQPLTAQGLDDAIAAGIQDRLAAIDRALATIDDGTTRQPPPTAHPIPNHPLPPDPP